MLSNSFQGSAQYSSPLWGWASSLFWTQGVVRKQKQVTWETRHP